MPELWQMCHHLSSTGNKDVSELIFTLPTHPNTSHSLCATHTHVHLYLCEDFPGQLLTPTTWPGPTLKQTFGVVRATQHALRSRKARRLCLSYRVYTVQVHVCVSHNLRLSRLGCVYPVCATGSEQHLFRGCCSSWLLFNWISSSRAKSCHLSLALLAITAGPYIK